MNYRRRSIMHEEEREREAKDDRLENERADFIVGELL
jgi:hypothetical protein